MKAKTNARLYWSLVYLAIEGLIFILGLNLLKWIPEDFRDVYKIGLPIGLLGIYLLSWRYFRDQNTVFLAFFLVSAGWTVDFYLTGEIKSLFSLSNSQLSGLAYTMLVSTLFVTAPVIIGWLLSRRKLADLSIQGSQKNWGIFLGLAGLFGFGGLGVLQSLYQGLDMKTIGMAIPLALVFSLANGFREELVYRAVFLKEFQKNIGVVASVSITTLVFVLAHLDVSYTPANLIAFVVILGTIGVVGSFIMRKTGSLIGAVLFHAGADVLLVLGMLSSQQLTLG